MIYNYLLQWKWFTPSSFCCTLTPTHWPDHWLAPHCFTHASSSRQRIIFSSTWAAEPWPLPWTLVDLASSLPQEEVALPLVAGALKSPTMRLRHIQPLCRPICLVFGRSFWLCLGRTFKQLWAMAQPLPLHALLAQSLRYLNRLLILHQPFSLSRLNPGRNLVVSNLSSFRLLDWVSEIQQASLLKATHVNPAFDWWT